MQAFLFLVGSVTQQSVAPCLLLKLSGTLKFFGEPELGKGGDDLNSLELGLPDKLGLLSALHQTYGCATEKLVLPAEYDALIVGLVGLAEEVLQTLSRQSKHKTILGGYIVCATAIQSAGLTSSCSWLWRVRYCCCGFF